MDKEYSNEYVKYSFSEDEKKEIAIEMARKITELEQLEKDKGAMAAEFKGKIDLAKAQAGGAATKLNNGYEMRQIKCEVVPDFALKIWKYVRTDTNEIAKERRMTSDDLQMQL